MLYSSIKEGIQYLSIEGDFRFENISLLKSLVVERFKESAEGYVIDLSKTTAIDSTGFGLLITLSKNARQNNKKIVFVVNNPKIYQLFVVAKFHLFFTIIENSFDAPKYFSTQNTPPTSALETIESY